MMRKRRRKSCAFAPILEAEFGPRCLVEKRGRGDIGGGRGDRGGSGGRGEGKGVEEKRGKSREKMEEDEVNGGGVEK